MNLFTMKVVIVVSVFKFFPDFLLTSNLRLGVTVT